jgi:hypothetical protein
MKGLLLTGLHFLSNDELLDRLAQDHHAIINNPDVLLLKPASQGRASWAELRAVNLRDLETAGKEIKLAKTEAEAQGATLRWKEYSQAYDGTNNTLFRIAERQLAQGPLLADRYLGLLAYGRPKPDANLDRIPETHWAAGTMDWQRRQLRMDHNEMWSGIEILNLSDLSPEIAAAVIGRQPIDVDRPTISRAGLDEFLRSHVTGLPPESQDLSESRLWERAQYEFPGHKVPRELVRDWIKNEMPAHLRKKPGRPPMR